MKSSGFALFADNENSRLWPVLSDHDRRCTACRGTGEGCDPADIYFGTRVGGCEDCQGSGEVPAPYDMSGEHRTLDDIDEDEALEREEAS